MESLKKRCFVLMPSGNHQEYRGGKQESDFVYDGIIVPALRKVFGDDVAVMREVDNRNPGAITRDLVQHIAEADICIVDVTGQNPNVFFELGIRYALRKSTTLLLKQPDTVIPFDITNYRWVEYSPLYHGVEQAISDIVDTIRIVLSRGSSASDSLVFEVYPKLLVSIPGVIEERGVFASGWQQMDWSEYWERFSSIANRLRDLFTNGRYVPNAIVGITNGGLIYADLLVREVFTGVPPVSLWADRQNSDGAFFDNPINEAIIAGLTTASNGKEKLELLLVDDIVASGNTLRQALGYLKDKLPHAHISFLPLFSRNESTFEALKDVFLWSSPLFQYSVNQMVTMHASDNIMLPYGKELRST